MAYTPIDISPKHLAEQAAKNFAGWHYAGSGPVQRTALAIIPNIGPCYAQFNTAVTDMNNRSGTQTVYDLRNTAPDCMTLFVKTLCNNGVTLQSKEDNMTLTRPLRVVVKAASTAHVATLCTVQSFTVTTSAFGLVENAAIRDVIDEAMKRGPASANTPACLMTKLMGTTRSRSHGSCQRHHIDTPSMKTLKLAPRFETLFSLCGKKTNVNPCVLLTQATAIIITAYEDAGSKFRDRASRIEAARHHGMAVDSVLMLPILRA